MRILILANIDMGLYKFRKELLELLAKEHEVFFCTPDGEYVSNIQNIGCKYISCNDLDRRGTNPIKDLKLIRFYKKTINALKPDVVLTYTIKPNIYGGIICAQMNVPYIANITGLGTTIENGGVLAKITTTLYKISLRKALCVFFQNQENRSVFVDRGIVKGKTRLLPGSGVNLTMHCLEPYPTDENGIHFLFVGRIMKDKGIEELLQAMRMLREKRNDVFLHIVGFCDEDYSKVLDAAEREGVLINHGMQNDVHPYYKACHCTVLPSYHEGMANVLLESSSTGRPVITTMVPGCRETFDEGKNGFGCAARSANSLYDAMVRFLQLSQAERTKMGLNARTKMEFEFDREIIVKAYQEEISVVLNCVDNIPYIK